MIKAVAGGPGATTTVMLGLSRENTTRLHNNQPILVRLRELHADLPDLNVMLFAGDTEDDLAEDLRTIGVPSEGIQRPTVRVTDAGVIERLTDGRWKPVGILPDEEAPRG